MLKSKTTTRALSAAWSEDGQILAVGLEDSTVSIRDRTLAERMAIQVGGPVWGVCFGAGTDKHLVAAAWGVGVKRF